MVQWFMDGQGVALHEPVPDYPSESNGEVSLLSFIVRLWKEEAPSDEQKTGWRGHITAVSNGKRQYFTNINEIPDLIMAHLKTYK
jgi:hypothetical protein